MAVLVVADPRVDRDWTTVGAAGSLQPQFDADALIHLLGTTARPIHSAALDSTSDAVVDVTTARDPRTIGASWSRSAVGVARACPPWRSRWHRVSRAAPPIAARSRSADLALEADQAMYHDAHDVVPGVHELVDAHALGSARRRDGALDALRRRSTRLLAVVGHAAGAGLDGALRARHRVRARRSAGCVPLGRGGCDGGVRRGGRDGVDRPGGTERPRPHRRHRLPRVSWSSATPRCAGCGRSRGSLASWSISVSRPIGSCRWSIGSAGRGDTERRSTTRLASLGLGEVTGRVLGRRASRATRDRDRPRQRRPDVGPSRRSAHDCRRGGRARTPPDTWTPSAPSSRGIAVA